MHFFFLLLMVVSLRQGDTAPHYPLVRVLVAHPYSGYDYSQLRPSTRPSPLSTLVHNSVSYRVPADAQPDDALEVAQFHSQDAAGRVVFGFNTPDQSRMEARAIDGSVRGSYSYQDPTGKIVKMHYWDDGMGFHTVGNNLPAAYYTAPQYTPEVQAARERHFQLYRQALAAALATNPEYYEEPAPVSSVVSTGSATPSDPLAETPAVEDQAVEDQVVEDQVVEDQVAEDSSRPGADYDADSDAVEIESADFSFKAAVPSKSSDKSAGKDKNKDSKKTVSETPRPPVITPAVVAPARAHTEPEANRKQVAQPQQMLNLALEPSSLALARTGSDGYQYLIPVAPPLPGQSQSFHAALYGAVPVAAVHDSQVSPVQQDTTADHQRRPLLLHTGFTHTQAF